MGIVLSLSVMEAEEEEEAEAEDGWSVSWSLCPSVCGDPGGRGDSIRRITPGNCLKIIKYGSAAAIIQLRTISDHRPIES